MNIPITDPIIQAKISAYREKSMLNHMLSDQQCLDWMAKEERAELEKEQERLNPKPQPLNLAQFKYDKIKDGWTLLEDVLFDGKSFVPDIVEFLKSGEYSIKGEVMKQRAKELNAHLGQHHAEYLLEHLELIPKEWRDKYLLIFPGTVWQFLRGRRYVLCLYWFSGYWVMDWRWLGSVWYGAGRLVVCK